MTLFRCERMSASISREACKQNQQRADGRCFQCSGLGATVNLNVEDRRVSKCNYKNCGKEQVVKGFCTSHARAEGFGELIEKRNALGRVNYKADQKPAPKVMTPVIPPVVIDQPLPVMPVVELRVIDLTKELDASITAKRDKWVAELAEAKSVRDMARDFLNMLNSIEGLGY